MLALSIIVGGWLPLNAVVFAALMLRRDQPALRDRIFRWVVGDEVHDQLEGRAAIGTSTRELGGDVVAHVVVPALGGVEADDADGGRLLALEQTADQLGVDHVGLTGQTELAGEVHESSLANPTDSPSLRSTVGPN